MLPVGYAPAMDAEVTAALKALTDPVRLRIAGRIASTPATTDELAADLELPLPTVVRHLGLLRRARLASDQPPWMLRLDTLHALGRALDEIERTAQAAQPPPTDADGRPLPADEAKILRGYLEDGRLTTIPAQSRKRVVVLRWLRDQVFTEDRDYPEKEVNQRLAIFHPDVAAVRRYMVDERLVTRENRLYRRA